MHNCLAVDVGAGSGRVIRGTLDGEVLSLAEIERFDNSFSFVDGHYRWDVEGLVASIVRGLTRAIGEGTHPPAGVGVDTWGVDFVLLDDDHQLLEQPVAYRDDRTDGMMERFFQLVDRAEVYARTGIQFMKINTLFQVLALRTEDPGLLEQARRFLMIPDYLHYRLSGVAASEFTEATTSQMLNIETGRWDETLLGALGLDRAIFSDPVPPGTVIGTLQPAAGGGGAPAPSVIMPASHDTGSAVAAVPAAGDDWAFISSGTWCLMGVEVNEPVATAEALALNFTNEGGVCGTYRLLKNLMGLWLVDRLKEDLATAQSYEELIAAAAAAPPFATVLCAADERFFNPASMKAAVDEQCRVTGQSPPDGTGAYIRAAMEGLGFLFRQTLAELRRLQPKPVNRIHVLGGGCRNTMLCRMIAGATGLPVFAGPVEGTATGNILVQAMAGGGIDSLSAGRAVIRNSFDIAEYEPAGVTAWDDAWPRFEAATRGVGPQ